MPCLTGAQSRSCDGEPRGGDNEPAGDGGSEGGGVEGGYDSSDIGTRRLEGGEEGEGRGGAAEDDRVGEEGEVGEAGVNDAGASRTEQGDGQGGGQGPSYHLLQHRAMPRQGAYVGNCTAHHT